MAADSAAPPIFFGMTDDGSGDSGSDSGSECGCGDGSSLNRQTACDSGSESDNDVATLKLPSGMRVLDGVDVDVHAAGAHLIVEHVDAMLV